MRETGEMKEGIASDCMYAWEIYVNKPKFDDRKQVTASWDRIHLAEAGC